VQRKIVYIQSDKTFRAVFDTTGLKKGTYKIDIPVNGLGDSVSMRVVNLVDRSDDIQLISSAVQNFNRKLYISGSIKGNMNSGVQIEVTGPDNSIVFGPHYINTNYQGDFSIDIPIIAPGNYEISFTDTKGYVGKRTINVIGEPKPFATPVVAVTTPSISSAHTKASRDTPAYFIVKTGFGPFNISTSSSVDWVVEYIDDNGALHMVNDYGELNAEKVQLLGKGKTLHVKVYPYKYSVNSDVFLYAENANSVTVSHVVTEPFAANAQQTLPETQQASAIPVLGIAAIGLLWAIWR
jgi:hypothetical protein